MMVVTSDIVIVGAGIFGITAALELRRRGYSVLILDPGPLPHPQAASTDISKVIRVEYGADATYMQMGADSIEGWRRWNQEFGEQLYHEVGVAWLTCTPMQPGGYEYESYQLLLQRGYRPERLDSATIARRFPALNPDYYVDGFLNPDEGYAESGRAVAALVQKAMRERVQIVGGQQAIELVQHNNRVTGVRTDAGETFTAGTVVVAAGSWSPVLLPQLWTVITITGQPVFHLKPAQPELFTVPTLTVFTADLIRTGWYGFPLHPREGVIKIGNHALHRQIHPVTDERNVTAAEIAALWAFVRESLPALARAELVYTRCCLYCNTFDEDFFITRVPFAKNVVLATGGSGHGFKFGPILGNLIADAVEDRANPLLARFAWRTPPSSG